MLLQIFNWRNQRKSQVRSVPESITTIAVAASIALSSAPFALGSPPGGSSEAQFEPVPMQSAGGAAKSELADLENEITSLYNQAKYTAAIPVARKAVQLAEKLGDEELVACLLNLSSVLQAGGEAGDARQTLERAMRVQEKAGGPEHPDLAVVQSKLGTLLKSQGDYDSAEPLFRKAIAINEKAFGEDSLDLARDVKGLASLFEGKGDAKTALTLYERVERIERRVLTKLSEEPQAESENSKAECLAKKVKLELELADVLNDQSAILQGLNDLERSRAPLEAAIEIRQRLLGKNDIEVAELMNNQASLLFKLGKLDEAKSLLGEVAGCYQNTVGSTRFDLVTIKNNLGELNQRSGDLTGAHSQFVEAGVIFNEQSRQILPMLSLAEQRAFIDEKVFPELSLLLDSAPKGDQVKAVYELIYSWKGSLIDAMRNETRINSLASDERFAGSIARLKQIRSEMAGRFYSAIANDPAEWARKNKDLTEEKEQIERQLTRVLPVDSAENAKSLTESLAVLGDNEILVDIYLYNSCRKAAAGTRYGAMVCSKSAAPMLVDLGPASEINTAVTQWHEDVVHTLDGKKSWNTLSTMIWGPVSAALPKETGRVWVCPDDELYRIPWHLFAKSDDKTTGLAINEADSVREIFSLRKSRTDIAAAPPVLLVGGVDFDADGTGKQAPEPAASATEPAANAAAIDNNDATRKARVVPRKTSAKKGAPEEPKGGLAMRFLPGTLGEIASIETLAKSTGHPVVKITGAGATEDAVVRKLASSSFVHLATHGVFLDDLSIKQVFAAKGSSPTRSIQIRAGRQWADYSMKRNPLVTSVIALAGANRESAAGGLNGILSAEEVVGLNLRHCDLITLSACETGAGRRVSGQGVMGLRSSFIAAGTKALLISLWKVPDEPTQQLMKDFYENLWVKKMTKLEALRQAQLSAQKKIYGRLPVNWAAWVLVGE